MKKWIVSLTVVIVAAIAVLGFFVYRNNPFLFTSVEIGDPIDSLNHVVVYYNSGTGNVSGRNTAPDGYNIGLKYQCVEFVKRYYYQHYNHKMPNPYGNAVDFYNKSLSDGNWNPDRGLTQYSNPGSSKPRVGDLIVLDATSLNGYGHVAIISGVSDHTIEIIQQNGGKHAKSRVTYGLISQRGRWQIDHSRVLGWLRKNNAR
ncbi:CHAP domain-containing protein [Fluviicola sp.]|uniref:CHAP domain-containing protein n=1 Tax=Fluviicola sp. TaxID=1917219 RepID=UPI0031DC5B33